MKYAAIFLFIFSGKICCNDKPTVDGCLSPQYLELGKTGVINCKFKEEFYAVLWYSTIDFQEGIPSIRYQGHSKSGHGYESGEFDVYPNGSLVINEVFLSHDDVFTVAYSESEEEFYDVIRVRVVVVVKPDVPFPFIDQCNAVTDKCFADVELDSITCSVRSARPNITLSLTTKTIDGEEILPTNTLVTPEGAGYTSSVSISVSSHHSHSLFLLVCKASSPPGLLKTNKSTILVLNACINGSEMTPNPVYITRNTEMELNCTNDKIGFFVWKKANSFSCTEQEILLYSVLVGDGYAEVLADDVETGNDASLKIPSTQVKHEGIYFCIFGDGISDGVKAFNVSVIVIAYPMIDECNNQQYCVLKAKYVGNLTCALRGIRPSAQLRWRTISDEEKALISFENQHLTVTENHDTFDVTLYTEYLVRDKSRERLIIGCEVLPKHYSVDGLTKTVDLLFTKGTLHEETFISRLPLFLSVIVGFFVILAICGIVIKRCIQKKIKISREKKDEEEGNALVTLNRETRTSEGKRQTFLLQLQEKYKDLYYAVNPIPYTPEIVYCVDNVFVESGIEYLESGGGMAAVWKSLDSYQNVLTNPKIKSKRRIIEGEPGYGKSTITLMFAYDWCNSISFEARDIDILILLSLKQLGGTTSIYKAIKKFILPEESCLSESDIKLVLSNSPSVMIILDGFDEYPDRDSLDSDIISIIEKKMFQNFEVVLTTRSSFLPKKYPASTKRIRLTGFDDTARRSYIQKAVVDKDNFTGQTVERHLQENPILKDLCQVPLLFVLFAHMIYDHNQLLNLDSATRFFRYIVSCFHSHMKNKMEDENSKQLERFETDHHDLDKVAFNALKTNNQKTFWRKEDLCEKLGQEFYEQYVRIGILVEEKVIEFNDNPNTPITKHVQWKTVVRFYHKLFCEWYAAHYLSVYLQVDPGYNMEECLRYLNPHDVQYVYRFGCGLHPHCAETIIKYLTKLEGGDKFAILCILEQTGKIDKIKETIQRLCFEGIVISAHDSLLLQRSSMQLLEIASRHRIPMRGVILHNCLKTVNLEENVIVTISGLKLSGNIAIKGLWVDLTNRDMTKDEASAILKFSSKCPSLLHLTFAGSLPPRQFDDRSVLSTIKSRKIKENGNDQTALQRLKDDDIRDLIPKIGDRVKFQAGWNKELVITADWGIFADVNPGNSYHPQNDELVIGEHFNRLIEHLIYFGPIEKSEMRFILNLDTGEWTRDTDGAKCTDEDFGKMEALRSETRKWTNQDHENDAHRYREVLRLQASGKPIDKEDDLQAYDYDTIKGV